MENTGPVKSRFDLEAQGFQAKSAYWNLTTAALYEQAVSRGEAELSEDGALVCKTGAFTGRAAKDKFFVEEPSSKDKIWWGKVNQPISQENFDKIFEKVKAYMADKDVFVQDCWGGASTEHRLPVRVINEHAWHNLFARNMFITARRHDELPDFEPGFTVVHMPGCKADPATDGTNSETFILCDLAKKLVLIGGTYYAGEIKKSIFTVLNYLLPEKSILPMHCSANMDKKDRVALFFGLSGTGKTTLSADSSRVLIGDDEHGWADDGVFNFEGGCYAKVIKLSPAMEPEIYATTKRFGTILENVVMDPKTRKLDLDDNSLTENTRASYPIDFIPNASETGWGGQPANIMMLTCDAYGVLPPISKLTPEQAMFHFLSGYTAKVAGTEKGVTEPTATFSTCFGAPFMPRHATEYAKLLGEKMAAGNVNCWLVNTGWTGGAYGTGERMNIAYTRAMVNAALDGDLNKEEFETEGFFGLSIPKGCPSVPAEVLNPRSTWADKDAYDAQAQKLAGMFEENFKQFGEAGQALVDGSKSDEEAACAVT